MLAGVLALPPIDVAWCCQEGERWPGLPLPCCSLREQERRPLPLPRGATDRTWGCQLGVELAIALVPCDSFAQEAVAPQPETLRSSPPHLPKNQSLGCLGTLNPEDPGCPSLPWDHRSPMDLALGTASYLIWVTFRVLLMLRMVVEKFWRKRGRQWPKNKPGEGMVHCRSLEGPCRSPGTLLGQPWKRNTFPGRRRTMGEGGGGGEPQTNTSSLQTW